MKKQIKIIALIVAIAFVTEQICFAAPEFALRPAAAVADEDGLTDDALLKLWQLEELEETDAQNIMPPVSMDYISVLSQQDPEFTVASFTEAMQELNLSLVKGLEALVKKVLSSLGKNSQKYKGFLEKAMDYYKTCIDYHCVYLLSVNDDNFPAVYIDEESGIFINKKLWDSLKDKRDIFNFILAAICGFLEAEAGIDAAAVTDILCARAEEQKGAMPASGKIPVKMPTHSIVNHDGKKADMPETVFEALIVIERAFQRMARLSGIDNSNLQTALRDTVINGVTNQTIAQLSRALEDFYAVIQQGAMDDFRSGENRSAKARLEIRGENRNQKSGYKPVDLVGDLTPFINRWQVMFSHINPKQPMDAFYIEKTYIELMLKEIIGLYIADNKAEIYERFYITSMLNNLPVHSQRQLRRNQRQLHQYKNAAIAWIRQQPPQVIENQILANTLESVKTCTAVEIPVFPDHLFSESPQSVLARILETYTGWANRLTSRRIDKRDMDVFSGRVERIFRPLIQQAHDEIFPQRGRTWNLPVSGAAILAEESVKAFPLALEKDRPSILEASIYSMQKAAEIMEMDEVLLNKILKPKEVIIVEFNVRLHNGKQRKFYGVRVHHNDARGVPKGGFRWLLLKADNMEEALEEAKITAAGLASLMVIKSAVVSLPFGGGKGDIVIPRGDYNQNDVAKIVRGFARELTLKNAVGPFIDVPAPDKGTDANMMAIFLDEFLKVSAEKNNIYEEELQKVLEGVTASKDPKKMKHLNAYLKALVKNPALQGLELATITGKPVGKGGSKGRGKATGFGGFIAFKKVHSEKYAISKNLKRKAKIVLNKKIKKMTIGIQGATGNVGEHDARCFFKEGAKIRRLQDYDEKQGKAYTIYNPNGIDVEFLFEKLGRNPENGRINCLSAIFSDQARLKEFLREEAERNSGNPDYVPTQLVANDSFLTEYDDVKVLAATENVITAKNAKSVKCGVILELANNPITPQAAEILIKMGMLIIPDVLANTGGVIVSYFEWLQNIEGRYWNEISVDKMLTERIENETKQVIAIAKRYEVDLKTACFILALGRIADAEIARSKKLQERFKDKKPYNGYGELGLNPETLEELRESIEKSKYGDLIDRDEREHTWKIASILSQIGDRFKDKRGIVLVSGPRTSGKTQFSQRIKNKLGEKAKRLDMDIILDDYEKELIRRGSRDPEKIYKRKIQKMRSLLSEILNGREVDIKVYNNGDVETKKFMLGEDETLVVEGDYALDNGIGDILSGIPAFRIFVNTAPSLKLAGKWPLTSLDLRFMRHILSFCRLLGDNHVLDIIRGWPATREHDLAFVYRTWQNADVTFNSYLSYELPVLKPRIKPLLQKALRKAQKENDEKSVKAIKRLLARLAHVPNVYIEDKIPPYSILRQLIGGISATIAPEKTSGAELLISQAALRPPASKKIILVPGGLPELNPAVLAISEVKELRQAKDSLYSMQKAKKRDRDAIKRTKSIIETLEMEIIRKAVLAAQIQIEQGCEIARLHYDIVALARSWHLTKVVTATGAYKTSDLLTPQLLRKIKYAAEESGIKVVFDVHFAVERPSEELIKRYINAGADHITLHWTAFTNKNTLARRLTYIQDEGCKFGIACGPDERIEPVLKFLQKRGLTDKLAVFHQMTTLSGRGGQKFLARTLLNVYKARERLPEDVLIEVDGGMDPYFAVKEAVRAGADIIVTGEGFFGKGGYGAFQKRDMLTENYRKFNEGITKALDTLAKKGWPALREEETSKYYAALEALRILINELNARENPQDPLIIGLGSGTTVRNWFLQLVREAIIYGQIKESDLIFVSSSGTTASLLEMYDMPVCSIADTPTVDMMVVGVDAIDRDFYALKGSSGVITDEKEIMEKAKITIVIADETKLVPYLKGDFLSVEAQREYCDGAIEGLRALGVENISIRGLNRGLFSPGGRKGNIILDFAMGRIDDPGRLAQQFENIQGIVTHPIFFMAKPQYYIIAGNENGAGSMRSLRPATLYINRQNLAAIKDYLPKGLRGNPEDGKRLKVFCESRTRKNKKEFKRIMDEAVEAYVTYCRELMPEERDAFFEHFFFSHIVSTSARTGNKMAQYRQKVSMGAVETLFRDKWPHVYLPTLEGLLMWLAPFRQTIEQDMPNLFDRLLIPIFHTENTPGFAESMVKILCDASKGKVAISKMQSELGITNLAIQEITMIIIKKAYKKSPRLKHFIRRAFNVARLRGELYSVDETIMQTIEDMLSDKSEFFWHVTESEKSFSAIAQAA